MTGTLIQRSEGSWSIVVYLGRDPISGKKRQKWNTFHGNKKQAQAELTRTLHEFNTGAYVEPAKLTVAEYLERWLNDYAKTNVAGKTFERYCGIVRRQLVPALGSVQLCKLKPLQIQSYYSQALQSGRLPQAGRKNDPSGLSARTVLHHHRVLHDALALAVEWQLLARNPADAVRAPKPEAVEMRALNEAETVWLLEVAKGTRLYVPVLFAVTTGVRRGELVGLRWADIASDKAAIRRSVEQTKEGGIRFKPPKGRKGRPIELLQITLDALAEHRQAQGRDKLSIGDLYEDQDLIFAREDGSIWKPDTLTTGFSRLAQKAGFADVRLHDLRHSHATQLLIGGVHPKIVSERLGHSKVSITLDLYSHVLPGMQKDAVKGLDAALSAAVKNQVALTTSLPGISKGLAN